MKPFPWWYADENREVFVEVDDAVWEFGNLYPELIGLVKNRESFGEWPEMKEQIWAIMNDFADLP